jgi:hypothetical protein
MEGVTILLVYRPEYEGLIQDQPWPKMQLDTNRKVISPFTENVAQEFLRKSGLTVNADLMRAVHARPPRSSRPPASSAP